MAKLVLAGGKHDEMGDSLKLGRSFVGEVIEGFELIAGSGMDVKVQPGTGRIPTGSGLGSYFWPILIDTSGGEPLTVGTADGGNTRWDVVVAYIISANNTTGVTNNPSSLGLKVVPGTPSSSPSEPSASTIQSYVGAGRPYIILGRAQVPAGVTSSSSFTLVDRRTLVRPRNQDIVGIADTSTGGLITVTFPVTFKSPPAVLATVIGGNGGGALTQNAFPVIQNITTSTFRVRTINDGGGISDQRIQYVAKGVYE